MNPQKLSLASEEVRVEVGDALLEGTLSIPQGAQGIIVFAHGSGSSRFSSRNRFVAQQLNEGGLGTLLFDLLTGAEHRVDQQTAQLRFDIALLSRRLAGACDWLGDRPETSVLAIGLFGASTGAAAALVAAAERAEAVGAVVSRGEVPIWPAITCRRSKPPHCCWSAAMIRSCCSSIAGPLRR